MNYGLKQGKKKKQKSTKSWAGIKQVFLWYAFIQNKS